MDRGVVFGDRSNHPGTPRTNDGIEPDFATECRAVVAQTFEFPRDTHAATFGVGKVLLHPATVNSANVARQQIRQRECVKFLGAIAEHRGCTTIRMRDTAMVVDHQNREWELVEIDIYELVGITVGNSVFRTLRAVAF
jgi:hypothetical protein